MSSKVSWHGNPFGDLRADGEAGSYPERPKPRDYLTTNKEKSVFIGGNEGLAVLEEVPSITETGLKAGDWGTSLLLRLQLRKGGLTISLQ